MDFELTEEQKLLQKSIREFAESEVKQLDETGHFPLETFRKAADLGLAGVTIPEAEGGAGFDHVAYTIVPTKFVPFGIYGAGLWTGHPIGLVIVFALLFMGSFCDS